MKHSHTKGAAFERDICQRLSMWVSNLTRQDVYWRSSMSGGRATIKSKGKARAEFSAHSGDVAATHSMGHLLLELFVVDCKHYKTLDIHLPAFGRGRGVMIPQWEKLVAEADRDKKCPLMVAKQNRQPPMVFTDSVGLRLLSDGRVDPGDFAPHCCLHRYDLWMFQFLEMITELEFDKIRVANGREPLATPRKVITPDEVYVIYGAVSGNVVDGYVYEAKLSDGSVTREEFEASTAADALAQAYRCSGVTPDMIRDMTDG